MRAIKASMRTHFDVFFFIRKPDARCPMLDVLSLPFQIHKRDFISAYVGNFLRHYYIFNMTIAHGVSTAHN